MQSRVRILVTRLPCQVDVELIVAMDLYDVHNAHRGAGVLDTCNFEDRHGVGDFETVEHLTCTLVVPVVQ